MKIIPFCHRKQRQSLRIEAICLEKETRILWRGFQIEKTQNKTQKKPSKKMLHSFFLWVYRISSFL